MEQTDVVQSRRGRPIHDLTGRIFGCLIPVEHVIREKGGTYWKCGCTARGVGCVGHTGELKEVAATSLKRMRQKTCGCRQEFNLQQKNEGRSVPGIEREATSADYAAAGLVLPDSLFEKIKNEIGLEDLTDQFNTN
jgi:hypothetical protein